MYLKGGDINSTGGELKRHQILPGPRKRRTADI